MTETTDALTELEEELARVHLRGQWQGDPQRAMNVSESAEHGIHMEPVPSGVPYIWPWSLMEPLLAKALNSMAESKTARRTLSMTNPGLAARGTTQNLITAIQIIHPDEVAWVHRHTITALRFVIQGGPDVYTVVDGEPLVMEPYDLILTPNWTWHDHHNQTDRPAIWLDALDVPLMHNLNQIFYEEPAAKTQNARTDAVGASPLYRKTWEGEAAPRPLRYPWRDTLAQLERNADEPGCPHDGIALEYLNTQTGGSALRTIGCWVQMLPPGFQGVRHRHTSGAVYFVIGGEGATEFEDQTIDWHQHDTMAVPNWTWHRHVNRSSKEPAYLFSVNDIPVLRTFGLYREEAETSR